MTTTTTALCVIASSFQTSTSHLMFIIERHPQKEKLVCNANQTRLNNWIKAFSSTCHPNDERTVDSLFPCAITAHPLTNNHLTDIAPPLGFKAISLFSSLWFNVTCFMWWWGQIPLEGISGISRLNLKDAWNCDWLWDEVRVGGANAGGQTVRN